MGYFSNSSEGMNYEENWCSRCLHYDGCSVLAAHWQHNYKECNNPDSILHILIPRSANGLSNLKCTMFVDKVTKRRTPSPRGPLLFGVKA